MSSVRPQLSTLEFLDLGLVLVESYEVYRRFAEAHRFQPVSVALPLGARAHWIGNPSVDKIVVFYHGKAKRTPTSTMMRGAALPPTAAICILSYSLAVDAQYPLQLHQAVLLLKYLVVDQAKQPKNITLCGDSAGGNLILGLLSHLLHPHPSLPPLTLLSPLLGAALVSPWGDFSTRAPSFTRNAANDSINGAVLQKWAACFMNGARADNYNQPFLAADHWWRNLQGVVQELLITVGTDEVLVDGIKGFTKTIEAVHPRTRAFFAPREFHDQPFMETDVDVRRCQQGRVLKAWLVARI
ncbi:MAG: hypothetical protein Q9180_004146 [Flavoplaca navasiana]